MADEDDLWTRIKGWFPQPEEPWSPKSLDTGKYGPLVDRIWGADTPERAMLDTFTDKRRPLERDLVDAFTHQQRQVPMPQKPGNPWLGALGGAFAAGAYTVGNNPAAAGNVAPSLIAHHNRIRERYEDAAMGRFDKHADELHSLAKTGIEAKRALDERRRVSEATLRAHGFLPPAGSTPGTASPGAGPIYGSPPLMESARAAEGVSVPAGGPPGGGSAPAAPAAPGGPPEPDREGPPDEFPFKAGDAAFRTQRWRDWYNSAAASITAGVPMTPVTVTKDGVSSKEEVKTIADARRIALIQDEADYRGDLAYKGKELGQQKRIEYSYKEMEDLDKKAGAASESIYNLTGFEQAFRRHVGEGSNTGSLANWAAFLKSWTGVGDPSNIEQMRKASLAAAGNLVKAAVGAGNITQQEFQTFLSAVTSAELSTRGNIRMLPFLRMQAEAELAIRNRAAQHMQEKGFLPWNFGDEADTIRRRAAGQAGDLAKQWLEEYARGEFGPVDQKILTGKDGKAAAASAAGLTTDQVIEEANKLRAANPDITAEEAYRQVREAAAAKSAASQQTGAAGAPAATPDAAAQPAGPKPTGTAPSGTVQDGWIMSPLGGWKLLSTVGGRHRRLWEIIGGVSGGGGSQAQPGTPASQRASPAQAPPAAPTGAAPRASMQAPRRIGYSGWRATSPGQPAPAPAAPAASAPAPQQVPYRLSPEDEERLRSFMPYAGNRVYQ